MGFNSGKKKGQQYCKKLIFQLPYPPSIRNCESDDTANGYVSRSSRKDDISDGSDSGGPHVPFMASDCLNLDGVLDHVQLSRKPPFAFRKSRCLMQPESIAYHHHPLTPSLASPKAATARCTASYRWNFVGEAPRYDDITLRNNEVLKPFFSFGTEPIPGVHYNKDNGEDECEENVSLLHGGSKMAGNSNVLIPGIFKPPKAKQGFSSSSSSPRYQKKESLSIKSSACSEASTCLMSKTNDWSERHLAFDLDSVVDEDEDNKCDFEHALWMLQMEEDIDYFQRVPPPPLFSNQFDGKIASVTVDKPYNSTSVSTGNTTDVKASASSQTTVAKNTNICTQLEAHKAGQGLGQKGNQKERSTQRYRRGHQQLECRTTTVQTKKSIRPSSKMTNSRRRRRSWYRGADFSPKLSTVTEQPSKEDETRPDDDGSTSSATLETSSASLDFCDAEIGSLHEC